MNSLIGGGNAWATGALTKPRPRKEERNRDEKIRSERPPEDN